MTAHRYWCDTALVGPPGAELSSDVLIEVADGRIAAVTTGGRAPADAVHLDGITLPGLANAHSHAFHRALRGRTHTGSGSFWTWREQMYGIAAVLDPDRYRRLARAVFAEMLLCGYTVVGEFHYLHHDLDGSPYADPNAMGKALVDAAADVGLRITLLDALYLSSGFGAPPDGVQRRFSDGSVGAWERRFDSLVRDLDGRPLTGVGAAVHSVRAVDPDAIAAVARRTQRESLPLHAHVSEQPAENDGCLDAYGATPIGVFGAAGALDERFTAVHATHLTEADIALLSGSGCTCCLCPSTERDLADGIGPAVALSDAGARLSIGSDSHAVIDPFEEMRGIELDTRLATLRRGNLQPAQLFAAGSVDGYRSLGWPAGGVLAPGALADLVTVSADSVRSAGVDRMRLDGLLFTMSSCDVRHVVVGGEQRVRDGRHISIDVVRELRAETEDLQRSVAGS